MADAAKAKPYMVGLTGSIAMGKTETGKLFASLGLPVYDADAVVHRLYERGGAAVAPVAKAFPTAVHDGRVDREKLTRRVAADQGALAELEAIVHPLVRQAEHEFLAAAAKRNDDVVILDIPLLYETRGEGRMDAVIVVSAPAHVQRERVLARPGMTLEKLEAIHARQVPDVDKRARADFVIETDKGKEHAFAQVKRVAAELRRRAQLKRQG